MNIEENFEFEDLLDFEEFSKTEDVDDPAPLDEPDTPEPDSTNNDFDEPEPTATDEDDSELVEVDLDLEKYYKGLSGYGLLDVPEDFEFDGTEEALEKAFEVSDARKTEKLAASLWERLPEDFKPLLSYALNGGKNLDSYLNAYATPSITKEQLDDDTSLQRKVVEEYYLRTSTHPKERIERMIAKLEDRGDLYEEALDALDELDNLREEQKANLIAQAKTEEEARQLEAQKQIEKLNHTIEKAEFLEDSRKNRVKSFVLAPIKVAGKTTTQFDNALEQVFNNEEHFIQLADLLADYNPNHGFNLDRLKKKLKTENNKSFKRLLDETLSSSNRGSAKKPLNEDFN